VVHKHHPKVEIFPPLHKGGSVPPLTLGGIFHHNWEHSTLSERWNLPLSFTLSERLNLPLAHGYSPPYLKGGIWRIG